MGKKVVTVTTSELERDLFNVTGDKLFASSKLRNFKYFMQVQ